MHAKNTCWDQAKSPTANCYIVLLVSLPDGGFWGSHEYHWTPSQILLVVQVLLVEKHFSKLFLAWQLNCKEMLSHAKCWQQLKYHSARWPLLVAWQSSDFSNLLGSLGPHTISWFWNVVNFLLLLLLLLLSLLIALNDNGDVGFRATV